MALVGAMNAIIIVSDHHWFATAIFFTVNRIGTGFKPLLEPIRKI